MDLKRHSKKLNDLREALKDPHLYGEVKRVHTTGAFIRDSITERLKPLKAFQNDPDVAQYKPVIDAAIDHLNRQRAIADALNALGPMPGDDS